MAINMENEVVGSDPSKPVPPDEDFALRYRRNSRYGFYMLYELGKNYDQSFFDIEAERFVVLDVNPQSYSMREPVATAISFTQGGGKIRESRGNLVKPMSISGTTGYLPLPEGMSLHVGSPTPGLKLPKPGALVPQGGDLDKVLGARSGFLAFHKLRYLFRRYAYELSQGRTDASLNFFDTKNEEYWRIEPQEFVMQRSSRKPFSYDYSISFTAIEPTTSRYTLLAIARAGSIGDPTLTSSGVTQSIKRLDELNGSGLDFLKRTSGKLQRKFQSALRRMNTVVGYFENVHDAFTTVLATPLVLLRQANSALSGVMETAFKLNSDYVALTSGIAATGFANSSLLLGEVNEWYLEASHLLDFLWVNAQATWSAGTNLDVVRENRKYSTGQAKQGTATALMQPTPNSTGTPDVNPFMPSSGLGLVTSVNKLANNQALASAVINSGDTIFSLAQRLLGDTQRFIDLVILNNLAAPYIVASKNNKPAGTIAWGEIIQIPAGTTGSQVFPQGPSQLAPSLSSAVTDTGTLYELIDTTFTMNELSGWIPNQWTGYTLTLTHLGFEHTRIVIGNDKDHLQINIPWVVLPSVGDSYRLELIQFSAHRPVTPEVRAFGSDVLLKFSATERVSTSTEVDVVINTSRDLSVVRGLSNMIQALNIRLRLEQGRLPLHPDFGVQIPVGRPWSDDLGLLYQFLLRSSLLQDPRVSSVSNIRINLKGDQFSLRADVRPISVKNSQPVSVTLP